MKLNGLARQRVGWLSSDISGDGIVMSSRARLARNIADKPFPKRADKSVQVLIMDKIVSVISSSGILSNAQIYRLNDLSKIDRRLLMERHLISHEHAVNFKGEPGLIFTKDEKVSIMINEEDHIRLQALNPGLSVKQVWETVSRLDDLLNEHLEFGYHPNFGYLTACPTNVGTGLRVSCLLHLPGLVMTDEIDRLIKGLSRVGLSARGFYGEGTKPVGDIFQISNAVTLGKTEKSIIDNLEKVIHSISRYEKEARKKVLESKSRQNLEDKIYRAYGILAYAKSIDSEEAMLHISKLKLGVYLKSKLPIKTDFIDQMLFIIQPAHLQELVGRELAVSQRDVVRTELIRKNLLEN